MMEIHDIPIGFGSQFINLYLKNTIKDLSVKRSPTQGVVAKVVYHRFEVVAKVVYHRFEVVAKVLYHQFEVEE